jgi:uridine kinase
LHRSAKRVILHLLIYENTQAVEIISMKSIFEIVRYHVEKTPADRPVLIGIDGTDGSGKSRFAANLASKFKSHTDRHVVQSSIDFFHNPKSVRHQDCKQKYVSFFEDSFNYPALKEKLLDPIKYQSGKPFCRKHFDHQIDREVDCPIEIASSNILLIFEGIFLHRDEIKEYWDFSATRCK